MLFLTCTFNLTPADMIMASMHAASQASERSNGRFDYHTWISRSSSTAGLYLREQKVCAPRHSLLQQKEQLLSQGAKEEALHRGIEPRSPALIGFNDKRKSSPLDQGRCDGRVTARPLGWLMEELVHLDIMAVKTTILCFYPQQVNCSHTVPQITWHREDSCTPSTSSNSGCSVMEWIP